MQVMHKWILKQHMENLALAPMDVWWGLLCSSNDFKRIFSPFFGQVLLVQIARSSVEVEDKPGTFVRGLSYFLFCRLEGTPFMITSGQQGQTESWTKGKVCHQKALALPPVLTLASTFIFSLSPCISLTWVPARLLPQSGKNLSQQWQLLLLVGTEPHVHCGITSPER